MSTLLDPKIRKEIKEFAPDIKEDDFIKSAVEDKLRSIKSLIFLSISEEIKKNLEKQGYSIEELVKDFND